jgi:hypothetical protein
VTESDLGDLHVGALGDERGTSGVVQVAKGEVHEPADDLVRSFSVVSARADVEVSLAREPASFPTGGVTEAVSTGVAGLSVLMARCGRDIRAKSPGQITTVPRERNLHDGAQQHLVALAVNLRLARRLVETDAETSAETLDQLCAGLQDGVHELRSLANGIYPPLLVDRGIAEALRSAADRAVLPTEVETDGLKRCSPQAEAAVYFCCMEALRNAAKHAGEGATVTLPVWAQPGALVFETSDTGRGFGPKGFGGAPRSRTTGRHLLGQRR